jgi:hypothetical protein
MLFIIIVMLFIYLLLLFSYCCFLSWDNKQQHNSILPKLKM